MGTEIGHWICQGGNWPLDLARRTLTKNELGKVMVMIKKACVQWVPGRMDYSRVGAITVSALGSNCVLYLFITFIII